MDVEQLLDRLGRAVALEGPDVAVRIAAHYRPQSGTGAKVFPPSYIADPAGVRYHFEERWGDSGDAVEVVILDSIQSQAGRAEAALRAQAQALGLPQLLLQTEVDGRTITVSNLEAPHRSRDAYFLDSEQDGTPFDDTPIGSALAAALPADATPFLSHAPCDLVYGVWDSHRGKRIAVRFPRIVTSEMLGWHVLRGKKGATKSDPLNLPGDSKVGIKEWRAGLATKNKKNEQEKLSELGHGMIPVTPTEATGGVAVKRITRDAVISLTGLSALRFPLPGAATADVAGRTALAAIALLGDRLAFSRGGLNLRSGCDLVLVEERVEWVQTGDRTEPLDLGVQDAKDLLVAARERLSRVGVSWNPVPVLLSPAPRLQQVIEQTFLVPDLGATS